MALVTRDSALYAEMAGTLRERRLPSISLFPGQRIPERVAVVLTTPAEVGEIAHAHILAVTEDGDRPSLWAAVLHALRVQDSRGGLIVGIDPGPRPGYAIVSGGTCIGQGVLDAPSDGAEFASHLRRRFTSRSILFRVGSGDPPSRNRLVNDLLASGRAVELVDEQGTTPRGTRRPRDMVAARRIAETPGRPVRGRLTLRPTAGAIADVQRLSRIGSDGRVTIPRSAAHRVLCGELTLSQAVAEALGARGAPAIENPRERTSVLHEPL
ncbi:MAG: hypothetical protein WAN74_02670 [Thermoplasmata archaeon]